MRTAAQIRYYEKNKAAIRAKDQRKNHHNKHKDAENRNQRNSILGWRWAAWSKRGKLTMDYESLSLISRHELEQPFYIFELRGSKRKETLFEPLPQWEAA